MTTSARSRNFAATLKAARIGAPEAQYEVGLMYANGVGTPQDFTQAIEWITKAAQRGLAAAQYLLATRYAAGVAVARDDRLALSWYMRASEQGYVKATFKLGQMVGSGNQAISMTCTVEAAKAGVPEAQYALGQAYAMGKGQAQNWAEASLWYEKSASQGYASAQYAYACTLMDGLGVARDPDAAVSWYRAAAAQDYPAAQVALELIDQAELPMRDGESESGRRRANAKERRKGSERWRKVAAAGGADEAYHVGLMHELGLGVAHDPELAKQLYRTAADQQDARAQLALAKMLEGEGDLEGAITWYEDAARQGNSEATSALGRLYSGRNLSAKDPLLALDWYARAASRDDPDAQWQLGQWLSGDVQQLVACCFTGAAASGLADAQYRLGECYSAGQGVAKSAQQAARCWSMAADQGHIEAAFSLGLALRHGHGVQADLTQAVSWFAKAAAAGHAKAQWNLGGLYLSGGVGVPQDLKLAFHYCQLSARQGFAPGQASLGLLYSRLGKPALAERWLMKAAEQGDAEACFNLASLLRNKPNATEHSELILQCLMDAAEQGLPQAQLKIGLMFAAGDGVLQDSVEGHKWLLIALAGGHPLAGPNISHSRTLINAIQITEAERRAKRWLDLVKFRDVKKR